MLKIDYVVKTDEKVEVVTHHQPDSLTELDKNILLIEGPGSSGKSTLLNMIAIGCFGSDDESLSESTRSNLAELSNDYRDVKFDIQISDPTSNAFLRLQKDKGKALKVSESMDGRPITAREFRNKYKLIYDVPEDPTKRLKNTTKMIKDDNKEIRNKIRDLLVKIADYSDKLGDVPTEQEIVVIREDLNTTIESLKNTQNEYDELKSRDKKCKLILTLDKFVKCRRDMEKLKTSIKEEEKKPASTSERLDSIKNKWVKKYQTLDLEENARQVLVDSRNEDLIGIAEQLNEMWSDLNPYNLDSSLSFLSEYDSLLQTLRKTIPKDDSTVSNARLANDLIVLLNEFDPNASLGELGTVSHIKEYLEKYKNELNTVDYSSVRTRISELQRTIRTAKTMLEDAGKTEEADESYRDDNKLRQWNCDLRDANEELLGIKEELQDLGLYDLDHPQSAMQSLVMELFHKHTVDEEVFKDAYKEWSDEFEKLDSERHGQEEFKEEAETKIMRYNEAKSLPFYGKNNEIQKIGDACSSLRSSLNEIDKRLDRIERQDKTEYNQHPELYEPIWTYVGKKLSTVRHRGETYQVESVNLLEGVKGVIMTVCGREIHIDSMGTGEGQQSYLKGLLSTDDSRKIIALFDEVGNMSGKILRGVIEDLEEKQKEGKLMLGILVQPRDDEKVSTYGL